ncbi:3-hydroxyacyl-CoA dehydrogenase NAD-binding domain-containing protein [uncultured Psychrobacter sp.]|uniref:3-hydroxyacyl-CoA dehydrogenase NAD-binding domain-containing protein n=1 Tax=uncultured Psychrobacter sp. TaxID=259303 RepID=UPI003459D467
MTISKDARLTTLNLTITDGIAQIEIDLPERSVNIFTPALVADLEDAINTVIADDSIKGAIISSNKSSFIVGADLKDLLQQYREDWQASEATHLFDKENTLFRRMETSGKPFVAALNGSALGGGLELALACHYRILSDNPKAVVGLPEVTVGLLPAGGGTQRLPRLIGIEHALPLLLEGKPLKPAQALALGVVDELATPDTLIPKAIEWINNNVSPAQPWDIKGFSIPNNAGAMAEHAGRSFNANVVKLRKKTQDNYPAPLAILSAVYEGTLLPFDLALDIESKYFGQLFSDPVSRNLIRTQFVNKGQADKLVNRPIDIDKFTVKKIGVIGAGMMGAGIAQVAVVAGISVVLIDNNQETTQRAKALIRTKLEKALAKKHPIQNIDQSLAQNQAKEDMEATLARIHPTSDYQLLSDCDMVIEAVFEDRDVKAEVFAQIEKHLKPDAVLASNTSTLPIASLATASKHPNRIIGLHFFSPVERMPLVEVIVAPKTSKTTLAYALDFVQQLRKTPIVVNDSPGFFTSRIFCSYIDEGMAMLNEGIAPALIENAAIQTSFAIGPLAVTDEVSLDLQQRVVDQAIADNLAPERLRLHAQPIIRLMNESGRLGRKTGAGFYDYSAEQPKRLALELASLYPVASSQLDVKDVADRLLYIQALESARCVEAGIISPSDADLGAILGLGFPTWTGGPLSFIDTIGIEAFVARCQQLTKYGQRFAPSKWLIDRAENQQSFYSNNS